jgi:hypothetical protein
MRFLRGSEGQLNRAVQFCGTFTDFIAKVTATVERIKESNQCPGKKNTSEHFFVKEVNSLINEMKLRKELPLRCFAHNSTYYIFRVYARSHGTGKH